LQIDHSLLQHARYTIFIMSSQNRDYPQYILKNNSQFFLQVSNLKWRVPYRSGRTEDPVMVQTDSLI